MQVIIHTGLYSELSILSAQQGHVNVLTIPPQYQYQQKCFFFNYFNHYSTLEKGILLHTNNSKPHYLKIVREMFGGNLPISKLVQFQRRS